VDIRKTLTDISVAETRPDGRVRCHLCLEFNKREYKGNWVLRPSFLSHKTNPIHLKAIKNQEEFLAANTQVEEIPESYATARDVFMDGPHKDRVYHLGLNDEAEQAMWENFDGHFEVDPSEDDLHEQRQKEFDHRAEEYGLWHGVEALPDDDMENIEQLWQEDEQDDILSELLEHTCAYNSHPTLAFANPLNPNTKTSTEEKEKWRMMLAEAQTAPGFLILQNLSFCWIQ
jgi:hypothetical protein